MSLKFLLIVPRKSPYLVSNLSVNGMFFAGSFITKDNELFSRISNYFLEDLYQNVTFRDQQELENYLNR